MLRDVLAPGLRIVFCGTAAGAASARRGAYYAGPGNAFWQTLFKTGLTPYLLPPEKFPFITEFGLGLTDLAKEVCGADSDLCAQHFDREGLLAKMRRYQPGILAFTGKRAAEEFVGRRVDYGALVESIGPTRLFVVPSTSGAARRYWSINPWNELAHCGRSRS
jgi:TDG/mug DNA glycosylase family protein